MSDEGKPDPLFPPFSYMPREPTLTVAALRQCGLVLSAQGYDGIRDNYAQPDSVFHDTGEHGYYIRQHGWAKVRSGLRVVLEDVRGSAFTLLFLLPGPLCIVWDLREHPALAAGLGLASLGVLLWMVEFLDLDWVMWWMWPVTAVLQVVLGEEQGFLFTHGLALVIALAVAGTRPDREVLSHVLGLMIPATVLLVLLSLLSPEVWMLAVELSMARILALAAVLILPLLWLVYQRISDSSRGLRVDLVDFDDPSVQANLRHRFCVGRARLATASAPIGPWDDQELVDAALAAIKRAAPPAAERFVEVAAPLVRAQLRKRFIVIVPAGIAVLTVLFYVLAAVMVPMDVAQRWTQLPDASEVLHVFELDLPLRPHLLVALILAIAATAIFLGFILTEEHHAETLTRAVFAEPAEAAVLFGFPYAALAVDAARDLLQAGFVPSSPLGDPPELPTRGHVSWWHVDDPLRRQAPD